MAPLIKVTSDIRDFYHRLNRIFKSGPIVRHRISNKITPPGVAGTPYGTARAFLRNTTNLYASQMASYGMYCIDGDTEIWVVDECGPVKIKDLVEKGLARDVIDYLGMNSRKKFYVIVKGKKKEVEEFFDLES